MKKMLKHLCMLVNNANFAVNYITNGGHIRLQNMLAAFFCPYISYTKHRTPVWSVNAPTAIRGVVRQERRCFSFFKSFLLTLS